MDYEVISDKILDEIKSKAKEYFDDLLLDLDAAVKLEIAAHRAAPGPLALANKDELSEMALIKLGGCFMIILAQLADGESSRRIRKAFDKMKHEATRYLGYREEVD
jgi:hypothetical protein